MATGRPQYQRLLRDERWRRYRDELLEVDGGRCTRCGADETSSTLHVHHITYTPGRLPWEYPYEDCEVLCAGCHAAEHGFIPPLIGWTLVDEQDLGDVNGTCERCGAELRYVFTIDHPAWEPMEVGTNRCDRLTGTREATARMKLKERRDRFAKSPRWKTAPGVRKIRQASIDIEIANVTTGGYMIRMNGTSGRRRFPSERDAAEFVFELLEHGVAQEFVQRLSRRR